MGAKKRKPLRSGIVSDSVPERKSKSSRVESGDCTEVHEKKTIVESTDDNENDEWEKIEQHQSKSNKIIASEDYNDDSSDGDDNDDDDEIKLEGSIEHVTEKFTFEFNDMREEYTEGICVLLRTLVQNPTKAYELAKSISAQTLVGTVVACEGGSDTFAFATVLPLSKEKLLRTDDPIGSIFQDLLPAVRKIASPAAESFLDYFLDSKVCTTGVFLHKRFSNLPIQLVGSLHINLGEDVGWAQHNHESDDCVQNEFKSMQSVMLLTACSLGGGSKLPEGQAVDVLGNSSLLFEYFEDEIFIQDAQSAFVFKAKSSATPLVAAIIPITSLKKCVNAICVLIPPADI